jgi:hypothetical protein
LTRYAHLLKRFVSKQHFFKKKLVLPAVPAPTLVGSAIAAQFDDTKRTDRPGLPIR